MKKIFKYFAIIVIILIILFLCINFYVIFSTKDRIAANNDQSMFPDDIDCIIVLGAGVRGGSPSPMLSDRLQEGINLYNNKVSDKIIMSGDHGSEGYDEVNIMKQYAVSAGVPSEDVFMDHAGFSTYDSIYRAKEIFKAHKIVIVTQKYHLYRALYIAKRLGLEAYGAGADPRSYAGESYREIREVLARDKDFFKCIIKPEPKYLGEEIPVSGDGNETND